MYSPFLLTNNKKMPHTVHKKIRCLKAIEEREGKRVPELEL